MKNTIINDIYSFNYNQRRHEKVNVDIHKFENVDYQDIKNDPFSVIDNIHSIAINIPSDDPFKKSTEKVNTKITVECLNDHVEIGCVCFDNYFAGKTSVTVCDENKASIVIIDSADVFVTMKQILNYLTK